MYTIYTDGSCQQVRKKDAKAQHGGYAAIINDTYLLKGYLHDVDYMDCEIIAAHAALLFASNILYQVDLETLIREKPGVRILTDCQSFVEMFQRKRCPTPGTSSYKRWSFKNFVRAVESLPEFDIKVEWIPRNSALQNKLCDTVARQQRELSMFLSRQEQAYDDTITEIGYEYNLREVQR